MAAEREGLAEGEPALAGEAAHFPMAARRSEQSQLSGQAVAARNILRPQNQGLLYICERRAKKSSEQNGCSGGVSKLILNDIYKKWKSLVYEKLAIYFHLSSRCLVKFEIEAISYWV